MNLQKTDLPEIAILKNDALIVYKDLSYISKKNNRSKLQIEAEKNLKINQPSGVITNRIQKKIQTIINNWVDAINYDIEYNGNTKKLYPALITLTLCYTQMHTDKELNRIALGRFIQQIKRDFGVINYLWRAEKQKNGNIHYHIIVDKFIHYKKINDVWNSILIDLEYVLYYQLKSYLVYCNSPLNDVEIAINNCLIMNDMVNDIGFNNTFKLPNSTDIHSLKSIKNVSKYLSKYMTKNDDYLKLVKLDYAYNDGKIDKELYLKERIVLMDILDKSKINARLWGCSDGLRALKDISLNIGDQMNDFIMDVINDDKTKIVSHDNLTIIYNTNLQEFAIKNEFIASELRQHKIRNFHHSYTYNKKDYLHLKEPFVFDEVDLKDYLVLNELSLQLDLFN